MIKYHHKRLYTEEFPLKNKYIIFLLILLSFALLLFCVSCNDANAEPNDEEKTELKTERTEKETEHVHTFGEWVTVKYPSCTEDGTAERECEECGECEQKNLSKTEHSLAQTVISPTCTAEGYTLYECKCGYSKTEDPVPKRPHSLTSTLTLPTCTSQGYTDYKCKYCDYEKRDGFVDPLPHELVSVTTPPTCTAEGYTDHECENCDYESRDSYVDMLPHDLSAEIVHPTFLKDGQAIYTCECSYVETVTLSYSDIFGGAYVENATVLANGIDVSRWNHSTDSNGNYLPLDWSAIKAAGIDFVIIKGGSTKTGVEPTFEMDYEGARAAGLEIGVYFYTYSGSTEAARADAELLLEALEGKYFEYPIYFDLEDPSIESLDKDLLMDMCIEFALTLQENGYYAALYTNHNWLTNLLDLERVVSTFDVWYARYPGTTEYVWDEEKYGKHLGMWQYTDKGQFDGIDAFFDLNFSYRDYRSIMEKWQLNGFSKI